MPLIDFFSYSVPAVGVLSRSYDSPSDDYASVRDVRHLEDEISKPQFYPIPPPSHARLVTLHQALCRPKCSSSSSSLVCLGPPAPWVPVVTAAIKAIPAFPELVVLLVRMVCVVSQAFQA